MTNAVSQRTHQPGNSRGILRAAITAALLGSTTMPAAALALDDLARHLDFNIQD